MKYLLGIVAVAVLGVLFWALWPGGGTETALKERETIPVTAEVGAFMDRTLELIRRNDMKALFKQMRSQDEVMFREYADNLFGGGDFCPAEVLGAVRLKQGAQNAVAVRVKSEKHNKVYQFNLIPRKDSFAVVSISAVQ